MTAPQAAILRKAVTERRNILVAGGTSTGKTTLTNALAGRNRKNLRSRGFLIEDTRELQCKSRKSRGVAHQGRGVASLSDLVRSSLRLRPDRIPIGEVRGAEALDLLKAWGTGHPGGASAPFMRARRLARLRRLEQLIQEAVITVPRALIAETIDVDCGPLRPRLTTGSWQSLRTSPGLKPTTGDYLVHPGRSGQENHNPTETTHDAIAHAVCYVAGRNAYRCVLPSPL